ncbi:MAG: hypothetical protein M1575_03725 [Patescibacteria group bacterium]|nr:hypothetical protein [Patescibacteria group bacterium]MCL5095801.1 hypothetical protein [Patescibacteria group bacterium]
MQKIKISCPGKIILMGEHAVVYGRPALVAAVDKRMTATIQTDGNTTVSKIRSEIPLGIGMGSSAALSVIQAASKFALSGETNLNQNLLAKINKLAIDYEKSYHVNSSGVDPTICTYGGVLWYKKTKKGKIFKKLKLKRLPRFILINTGKPIETTGEMVEMVRKRRIKEKSKIEGIFNVIEKQTKLFLLAIEKKDDQLLKNSIQNCESCLEDLGIVSLYVKNIVGEIEKIGGAAKICGGGGRKKETGLLLCYHQNPDEILKLGHDLGLEAFKVKFGVKGLTIV